MRRVPLRSLYLSMARSCVRQAFAGRPEDFIGTLGDAIRWVELAAETDPDAWVPDLSDEPAITTYQAQRVEA